MVHFNSKEFNGVVGDDRKPFEMVSKSEGDLAKIDEQVRGNIFFLFFSCFA